MTQPSDGAEEQSLESRYGVSSTGGRRTFGVIVVVAALALLGWASWASLAQSSSSVGAIVQSYDVRSPHAIHVTIQVARSTTAAVQCTVTAIASDHADVGETVITLPAGRSGTHVVSRTVKTERTATTATVSDCR